MTDLGSYLDATVYPALWGRLDRAYPEFDWMLRGDHWVATSKHTRSLLGEPRPDRVCAYLNTPYGFVIHGVGFVSWISYAADGRRSLRGKDWIEAVRDLCERANVDMPVSDPQDIERYRAAERRRSLLDCFAEYCHRYLLGSDPSAKAARDYLVDNRQWVFGRLFDTELGYCPSLDLVQTALQSAQYTATEISQSGLVPSRHTLTMAGRLVRPIRDPNGRIVTFVGRDLRGNDPKYLYLANRSKPSFIGLDLALRDRVTDCVIVEGILDVDYLRSRGIEGVISIGGAGQQLTPKRWQDLARFGIKSATLALDSDEPGRAGLASAIRTAQIPGAPTVYVLDPDLLGSAKDPDEYVRANGSEAFCALIDRRIPAAIYHARTLLAGLRSDTLEADKRAAIDRVLDWVADLSGTWAPLDRQRVLDMTCETTGYSLPAISAIADARDKQRIQEHRDSALDTALRAAQTARRDRAPTAEILADLSTALSAAVEPIADAPPEFSMARILAESAELVRGRCSGWAPLDRVGVRFRGGELAVIAARTGHAKTSILVNLLLHWLCDEDDRLYLFYSLEEPEIRVAHQLLSLLTANADNADFNTAWTSQDIAEWLLPDHGDRPNHIGWPMGKLDAAIERLTALESQLQIIHRPSWTIDQIVAHARERAAGSTIGAVFVDYLQRIRPPDGRYDRRDIEISAIGRGLKSLAVDLAVPVICAAQINRDAIPRDYARRLGAATDRAGQDDIIRTARPDLSHLREGGSEQESDLVLGVLNFAADYRSDVPAAQHDLSTPIEVGVLKNRYGAVGQWVSLDWIGALKLISDLGDF